MIQGIWSQYTLGHYPVTLWSLHLIWNSLDLKCRVEDLNLPPKYFCPYFGIFGIIDCINRDGIKNLGDSPRLFFIDEECGNLIVVNDGGEGTWTISQKKSDVLQ